MQTLDEVNNSERPICYGILMPGPDIPGGIPYVKVRDIKNDVINLESLHRTTPEIEGKYARARLRAGDVLVSIRGTYGRVAIVPDELEGGNITQDTARVAPVHCSSDYLAHYLRSPDAQDFLRRVARGVAVKGVNIGDLRRLPVPIPPPDVQMNIVEWLERRSSEYSVLMVAVNTTLLKVERLRHSILHAAFTGELTREWRENQNG
jgi:type I restriction enzyme S subunit